MGALSQSVWSSGLKEARGRLLVNSVPMLEQKKKKKKNHEEVYFFFFFQAGQGAALSSFRIRKNGIVVENGSNFLNLINKRCD